jgi:hypothetical protein
MKTEINVNNLLADLEIIKIEYENKRKKAWVNGEYSDAERYKYLSAGIARAMRGIGDRAFETSDDY